MTALEPPPTLPSFSAWIDGCPIAIDHAGPLGREFEPFQAADLAQPIALLFARTAARRGENAAIVDEAGTHSYAEIAARVDRLAARLTVSTSSSDVIGILLPSSADFMVALLACFAAGRKAVPIDLHYPRLWIAQVLGDARVTAIITRASAEEAIDLVPKEVAWIDPDATQSAEEKAAQLRVAASHNDSPALILYTSGSTGRPKGIVNSQRALLRRVEQYINAAHINTRDRFLPLSSECTIAGLRERLTALLSGATLYLADVRDGGAARILTSLRDAEITIIYAVPALLRTLIHLDADHSARSLRVVRVGGDAVLWADVAMLRRWLPPSCLIELGYSSTEAPIMQWFVPPGFPEEGPRIPIGYPLQGNELAIVDEFGKPVADGEVGELVLRSPYIALGRWVDGICVGDDYPTDPDDPSKRIQFTGDLARRRPDQFLDLIGRKDRQIKINGQRIEPAEIETVLRAWPGIREAVVVARAGEAGSGEPPIVLIAYFEAGTAFDETMMAGLRAQIESKLPVALRPYRLYPVESLPRLPSAKLDMQKLREIDQANAANERLEPRANGTGQAPETPSEQKIGAIWEQVLGCIAPARDADFFELGGTSLAAISMIYGIEKAFGVTLPVTAFYEARSIAAVAALIDGGIETVFSPLVLVKSGGDAPPLLLIHGVGGNVMELFWLGRHIEHQGPIYAIQARGLDGKEAPFKEIRATSEYYLAAIRSAQIRGPYRLAGYSYGGLVAFDLACLMQEQRERVDFLALIDSATNPRQWPIRVWLVHLIKRLKVHLTGLRSGSLSARAATLFGGIRAAFRRVLLRFGSSDATNSPLAMDSLPPVLRDVRNACIEAAMAYYPGYYPGRLTLMIAETIGEHGCDPRDIWRGHAGEIVVNTVPGDHMTMIESENGRLLAAQFTRALEALPASRA